MVKETCTGFAPMTIKGVCICMENKKNNAKVFWIVLAILAAVAIALALIIRTEKRLLRLVAKVEKVMPIKKKQKNAPIMVEL